MTEEHHDVVFDARWLGHTGVGRVTAALLDGFAALRPEGWAVWAPSNAGSRLWPEATLLPDDRAPTAAAAQRLPWRVPRGLVHLHPHAVRPLGTRSRRVLLVHDLIPVFHGSTWRRWAWRAFFTASLRGASHLLVYSEATRARIEQVVGVDGLPVTRVRLAVSAELTARIRALRASRPAAVRRHLLCVGQLKEHKNVPALVEAFARSRFRADGGRLIVVGPVGDPAPVRGAARRWHVFDQVDVLGRQTMEQLVSLYAGAAAVVQPSLEEGFGLPVMEALTSEIPVACSDIPAHREATGGFGVYFDPRSVPAIAEAIDAVVRQHVDPGWLNAARLWAEGHPALDPNGLALSVLRVVEGELAEARKGRSDTQRPAPD